MTAMVSRTRIVFNDVRVDRCLRHQVHMAYCTDCRDWYRALDAVKCAPQQ